MLNRSVSRDDPTHPHQSRYPKSRLFGYLPDLPSDVIACMNPVMLNPSPHKGYHCLRVQTHHHSRSLGRHRLHEPRDAEPFSPQRISLPKSSDPSPPQQVPKKSTRVTMRDLLHERRYPNSRLFGYLPDLPYVISCMNPAVMTMRAQDHFGPCLFSRAGRDKRTCKKMFGKAPSRINKA